MPIHDWTRVDAGLFHHFHQEWTVALCNALNAGTLPPDYFALVEQNIRGPIPDVLTLQLDNGSAEPGEGKGGVAVAVMFLAQVFSVIGHFPPARQTFPPLTSSAIDDVRGIGMRLFDNYNLPFQIVGILVLVATIGVVVLSKREFR